MRFVRPSFILFVLLIPWSLHGQTNVDKLTQVLDSVSVVSLNDWKVSQDLTVKRDVGGDPTKPGFDDSQWGTLRIAERIYPDSVWLRKEIAVPATILGQPVSGPLRLLLSVDDYGYLWVNGESKGYFPWDGEFELAGDVKPGQKFLLVIKAINTGGPLRLIRAQLESEGARPLTQLVADFSLSLRTGQKLLSFDTYQTNARARTDPGIDKSSTPREVRQRLNDLLQSLAVRVNVDALRNGQIDKFKASINEIRAQLKPIQEYVKQFTLFFDSNAHIDAAWLWRVNETVQVCRNTFTSVFTMMSQRPDFTYTQSSAAYYDWMETMYPEVFRKIQQEVKNGRWEVIGGMWVEPDCNLPDGESWMRHLLYAKRYFKQKLGADVRIGWNPDSFGYNGNMPLFYKNAGIDAFITQKIGWNETNVFPYRLFWWESPDGSRILSYFPFDYVNSIDNPFRLVDWLRQFDANTGFKNMMVLFGIGDHGGGPSLTMLDRIDHLKTLDIFPTIQHGTAAQYLNWVKSQDLSKVPTWKDELYLEYHQGTFTTQANMKRLNRSNEELLLNTEKYSTLATMFGGNYNAHDLSVAWKKVLLNQFHDILPGSGIREVYIDATESHNEAAAIGTFELTKALKQIARQVNTSSFRKGVPVILFNPLAWERTDIARVHLPEADTNAYAVFDPRGNEIPSQVVATGKYTRDLLFVATRIPSLGYATFELRRQHPTTATTALKSEVSSIENQVFRIQTDPATGWVKNIIDKRNGKEILSGAGNELQLLEDVPKDWDAWNVGWTGVQYPSRFRRAEVIEQGPVRVVLRLYRDYLKPGVKKDFPTEDFPSSFFTQDIVLYDGIDRIDFTTDVDWWEDKTMLKVAFPLAVSDSVATYEIPYGSIERSTQLRNSWEKAKVEVPAERWADISTSDYGVSLLNNAKYGYDIKGNVMRLSLLRSPKWPDPTADRGKHSICYALYPHAGRWETAGTVRRGYEFNYPLIGLITDTHKGTLPVQQSFVSLSPANLVLTTIKKAEDSDAWIFQWYDAVGENTHGTLALPRIPKSVALSNFLEEEGVPVKATKNVVDVETGHHSVVTLKVRF